MFVDVDPAMLGLCQPCEAVRVLNLSAQTPGVSITNSRLSEECVENDSHPESPVETPGVYKAVSQ
jgi:hypothetical protein